MLQGIEREPEARDAYQKETGIMMMPKVIEFGEYAFCSASLDGISFDGKTILEIKCPESPATLDLAKEGKIEPHYECQVQWQLMISKADVAHFWVYHPTLGTARVVIMPDMKKQKHLLDLANAFWDLVINDIEPEKEEDKFIKIDTPGFVQAAESWKLASLALKEAEAKEKEARAILLDETDGGNVQGCGIKVSYIEPEDCVDWKAAKVALDLTDEKLMPFMKKKAPYYKITMSKEGS
jgi:hypothetical protein